MLHAASTNNSNFFLEKKDTVTHISLNDVPIMITMIIMIGYLYRIYTSRAISLVTPSFMLNLNLQIHKY